MNRSIELPILFPGIGMQESKEKIYENPYRFIDDEPEEPITESEDSSS